MSKKIKMDLTPYIRAHLTKPLKTKQLIDLIGAPILQRQAKYANPFVSVKYQLQPMVERGEVIQLGNHYVLAKCVNDAPLPPRSLKDIIVDYVEQHPGTRAEIRKQLTALYPDLNGPRLDSYLDALKASGGLSRQPQTGIWYADTNAGKEALATA